MNSTVDVGLIILNQNQGLLLERCIRSALAQTFPGRFHEVVVADAGSTDFSREVIESYGSRIIPVFRNSPATLAEAFWEGVKRASGRYIVCLRAQDFISDYMILFQAIWLFQNPQMPGVMADTCLVEPGSDSKVRRVSPTEFPCFYGILWRKEVLVQEGLYEPGSRPATLEALAETLSKKSQVGYIPIPFYRYQMDTKEALKS